MRKLAASVGTVALTIAALVGAAGYASADTSDDHSVSDDHANYSRHNTPSHCADRHGLEVNCNNIYVLELGNIF